MLVKDVLQKTTAFFKDKGIETARLDTELLMSSALNWDRVKLYINFDYPLSEDELQKCRTLVRRRAQGEPVAYILGTRDFYNFSFHVEPGVLIPRPETEIIVEQAVQWLKTQEPRGSQFRIVDLGAGSGCIGLSILREVPNASLLAVDVSPIAIRVTETNVERLGVADRVATLHTSAATLSAQDVEKALGGPADVVVANPPYIDPKDEQVEEAVRRFEPPEALFAGESGLEHIRNWSVSAARVARAGAFVMFEIGADQSKSAAEMFAAAKRFSAIQVVRDFAQFERFIRCQRDGE